MNKRYRNTYERTESPKSSGRSFLGALNYTMAALIGVIFLIGVGVGIAFSSNSSFEAQNVVSREVIDRSAPNAELCIQYGASAIVTDMRVFVTLNPFSVYVTQPVVEPGCVLRRNNWAVLEQQKLVDSQQVNECKNRMNTFGFTGTLEKSPRINCVYQNQAAGNLFLNQPGGGGTKPENDGF